MLCVLRSLSLCRVVKASNLIDVRISPQHNLTCSGSFPMLAASLLSFSSRAIMEVLMSKNNPFQLIGIHSGCGR